MTTRKKMELTPDTLAFLYTATAKGHNSGIHFCMPIEDARRFCSDPRTQGVYCGTPWAYFYTSANNFFNCHWGGQAQKNLEKWTDNGKYDNLMHDIGCRKIEYDEVCDMLRAFGLLEADGKPKRHIAQTTNQTNQLSLFQ